MAILTKIRNRSGLAVGLVGLALALFVVSDALNSRYGLFSGNGTNTTVGEVSGDKISLKNFEQNMQVQEAMLKQRNPNQAMDENTRSQIREQVWNDFLQQSMFARLYADIGLSVPTEELEDMLYGDHINASIKQSFTDPKTGQFDKNNVKRYLKQLNEGTDENAQLQWKQYEDYIVNDALQRKISNLMKKCAYATKLDAKNLYVARTRNFEMNLICSSPSEISDSLVKTEDSDLKSYFNKFEYKYRERENTRKVDFIVWDFAPTSADSAVIRKWAEDQVVAFKNTTNDTAYVDANSDSKFDPVAKPRSAFPAEVVDRLFHDSVGSVIGPIFSNGKYQIFKVSGIKQDTVFNMHASHILFKVEGNTALDTANSKKKAEEVLARIKKGEDFGKLAMEFGSDATRDKGGDLGWFVEGQMVPEFNKAVMEGKKGDVKLVKTQFGWHIVKITDDKSKKTVCAGILERAIEPSDATLNKAYTEASQFSAACSNGDDFAKNVAERKIEKKTAEFVRENDNYLPGYNDAREAVRWAFNAKPGDVSEVITMGDKYVIATLIGIREKNKSNFELAKDRVKTDYIKDKKLDMQVDKIKSAMEGATTIDQVSKKLNMVINPVSTFNFENPNIPIIGTDNIFAGVVFNSKVNALSGPVKGENGVYAFQLSKITEAPEIKDYSSYQKDLSSGLQSRFEYGYMEALKDMSGLVDSRYKFY